MSIKQKNSDTAAPKGSAWKKKSGAIAFLDSQCPDHVCEQFGWLDKDGAWAACVPAGVYVVVEPTADGEKERNQAGLRVRLIFFLRENGKRTLRHRCAMPAPPKGSFLA